MKTEGKASDNPADRIVSFRFNNRKCKYTWKFHRNIF